MERRHGVPGTTRDTSNTPTPSSEPASLIDTPAAYTTDDLYL